MYIPHLWQTPKLNGSKTISRSDLTQRHLLNVLCLQSCEKHVLLCILIHNGSDILCRRVKGHIWHMEAAAAHLHALKTNEKKARFRLSAYLSVVGGGRGILMQERGLSTPLSWTHLPDTDMCFIHQDTIITLQSEETTAGDRL